MINVFGILLVLSLGMGCAHVHKVEGPQEMAEVPSGVKVGIGGKEVHEGDTVSVFKESCKDVLRPKAGSGTRCEDIEVGKATVLKVLDHESAIVEPQNGLVMDNSMKVEKQKGVQ